MVPAEQCVPSSEDEEAWRRLWKPDGAKVDKDGNLILASGNVIIPAAIWRNMPPVPAALAHLDPEEDSLAEVIRGPASRRALGPNRNAATAANENKQLATGKPRDNARQQEQGKQSPDPAVRQKETAVVETRLDRALSGDEQAANALYLDRSVDLTTLSMPFARFPSLTRVLPDREIVCIGLPALIDEIAPEPAPIFPQKHRVPYYVACVLQEAELINKKLREERLKNGQSTVGRQRSSKHISKLGPALLLDDDGDVFAREPALRALGCAAVIYSSHSYGFGKWGGRVVLFLNRPITPNEYPLLWDGINHWLGGGFDKAGRSCSQCYGQHARRSDQAPHRRLIIEGAALNADALIELGQSLKPVQVKAAGAEVKNLTEGNSWFEKLPPEQKDEAIRHALKVLAEKTDILKLTAHGGDNLEYYKLITAVSVSGAPHAEDLFVEFASKVEDADTEEALREKFKRCQTDANGAITVGTLLSLAQQNGASFEQWLPVPLLPPEKRKPLKGGKYSRDEALELLNSYYLIGKSDQEVGIFRIKSDGLLAFTPQEQFKLDVANIFVSSSTGSGKPVEKFWKESPRRHQRKIVFKPGSKTEPDEFNLWRGFGVEPRKGWQKQRRLLRHILRVICRRDKKKFKHIMKWLAWAVQNPDKHPGTIIVLKSRKQGTGKSTLGTVMLKIFGQHGALIDDSERLLGKFNAWLEPKSFILAEEILWAGDHKTGDKLKSRVTADIFQIEHKNGPVCQIPNRLHLMMTTNHDHAVAAGVGDRRLVVYDVSEEHACDKAWFDPLYLDLHDGGFGEFLYLLQTLQLGDWHPRQILKTAETAEQQRMSGDSISQWSQACVDADAVIGAGRGPYGTEITHDLREPTSTRALRDAYTGFCKQNGLRTVSMEAFGKGCTDMFGPRKRLKPEEYITKRPWGPEEYTTKRPWGYDVPNGETWQRKIDERLGI